MTLLLIVLFALSVAVTVRDVRYRLVYGEDVILLVALRVLAAVFALYPEVSGLQPGRWGFGALATSALAALAAAVLFWALGWLGLARFGQQGSWWGRRASSCGMLFVRQHCRS